MINNHLLKEKLDNLLTKTHGNNELTGTFIGISYKNETFDWSGVAEAAEDPEKRKFSVDTPYYIASITKLFTSTIIMMLQEQEKLQTSHPISQYLPKSIYEKIQVFKGKDYSSQITISQLLDHTSGIADYYTKKPLKGPSFMKRLILEKDTEWTPLDTIDFVKSKLTPYNLPGKKAYYSDTNYQLLGLIIEAITEKSLHEVYKEMIFDVLQLNDTYLFRHELNPVTSRSKPAEIYYKGYQISELKPSYSFWADGGILSTIHDQIIFLKALNSNQLFKNSDSLPSMKSWKKWRGLDLGYGIMQITLPSFLPGAKKIGDLIGYLGSTGSFLFHSKKMGLYIAGTINKITLPQKIIFLLIRICKLVDKHLNCA